MLYELRWAHIDHNVIPQFTNKNIVNLNPGLDLVPFWRLPCPRWAQDENRSEISGEVKAKMGPSCAKLRPNCAQDGLR